MRRASLVNWWIGSFLLYCSTSSSCVSSRVHLWLRDAELQSRRVQVPATIILCLIENVVLSELQRQVDEFESTVKSEQVRSTGICRGNALVDFSAILML